VAYFLMSAFLVSYLTTTAEFSNAESLTVQLVTQLVLVGGALVAGRAIDRVGRKPVAVASVVLLGAWIAPTFPVLRETTLLEACLVVAVFGLLYSGVATSNILLLVELFPGRVRTSASALSYQLASAVFGGSAPYIATWLVGHGHIGAPGYYAAGLCAVSTVVALVANPPGRQGRRSVDMIVQVRGVSEDACQTAAGAVRSTRVTQLERSDR
jgi:MHS family proline/betaine transporter-like MFS transporter